jgi:hypothetical protein
MGGSRPLFILFSVRDLPGPDASLALELNHSTLLGLDQCAATCALNPVPERSAPPDAPTSRCRPCVARCCNRHRNSTSMVARRATTTCQSRPPIGMSHSPHGRSLLSLCRCQKQGAQFPLPEYSANFPKREYGISAKERIIMTKITLSGSRTRYAGTFAYSLALNFPITTSTTI